MKFNIKDTYRLIGIIFFSVVFVLCPISNVIAGDNGSDKKKTAIDENIEKGTDKEATDDLYNYEKPAVEEESYAGLVIKTIIVLGLLIGGFYFFYRFVTRKAGIQTIGKDVVNVLSIVSIGQNKFLQVVEIAGRILIIGVSDSNINLITEIHDKDEIDRIRLLSSKSGPVKSGGFQEYLSGYIAKIFRKDDNNKGQDLKFETNVDRLDHLKKQRERLKKINGNNDEI
jgi:flagellar biogenesis protein FliO